jgi:FKBP-type peptidyl-prolyl cis-trans isomerase
VRKIQTQVLLIVSVLLIGFTMFSMANATTPAENKAAGAAFLAENAKKANIVTTASGLQYEVLTPGTGTVSPKATDNVTVHYKGTTLDGAEFDSSYSRGAPASFPLNRVIAGWTEGVQLMKEGAKYRFYIPSELAYGEQGAGRAIGPNAALIFDVELIKIQ